MWLRIILGVTYTAMAAGQLASWPRMPDILGAYDAVPVAALPWLASALIIGELVSGVWLAVRPRSRALAPVWLYTAVTLAWATLGLQAQLRGLSVDNCGCFGMYLTQRLSWFVLAQDALLLLYAVLMIRGGRRGRPATTSDSATIKEKVMTVRAVFRGQVIAESDDTVVVEGNHYFPAESVRREFLTDSTTHTVCPWKGRAGYYTVTVDGVTADDAAWYYPHPTPLARQVENRVAFWRGVQVDVVPAGQPSSTPQTS